MKKITFIIFSIFICLGSCFSQENYYNGTENLSGDDLRAKLCSIISNNYHSIGYGNRREYFCQIDTIDGYYWDIYSNCRSNNFKICSNFLSSATSECEGVNTEHSIPQYFFNANEPMKSDLFHIYPVSVKLNSERGNSPYGDAIAGLSGRWEPPLDEYKGDLARSYFYFATRYKNQIGNWNESFAMFSGNDLSQWAITMLLRWHEDDPVSQKEIDRNNKIYEIQHNRNPFIDCPCFAQKIWDNNFNNDCDCFDNNGGSGEQVSINKNEITNNINIKYYNNNINITTENQVINNIKIYDITGKIILNKLINNSELNENIEYFESGIYILNIKLDNGIEYSEKIIKY